MFIAKLSVPSLSLRERVPRVFMLARPPKYDSETHLASCIIHHFVSYTGSPQAI